VYLLLRDLFKIEISARTSMRIIRGRHGSWI